MSRPVPKRNDRCSDSKAYGIDFYGIPMDYDPTLSDWCFMDESDYF